MSISGIHSSQSAHEISRTQSRSKPNESSASHRNGSDSVTFSKEARELSAAAQASKEASAPTDEGLPLEAYSIPDWLTAYFPKEMSLDPEDPAFEDKLRRASAFGDKYNSELTEHHDILRGYLGDGLKSMGIESTRDYYEKIILDPEGSNKLRQYVEGKLEKNTRFHELMDILGVEKPV